MVTVCPSQFATRRTLFHVLVGCGLLMLKVSRLKLPVIWLLVSMWLNTLTKSQRSEERFSRNAETDLVCRLLLEKKKSRVVLPERYGPISAAQRGASLVFAMGASIILRSCRRNLCRYARQRSYLFPKLRAGPPDGNRNFARADPADRGRSGELRHQRAASAVAAS